MHQRSSMLVALFAVLALPFGFAIAAGKPTPKDAEKFMLDAESRLEKINIFFNLGDFVNKTYITDDTETISAKFKGDLMDAASDITTQAKKFEGLKLPEDLQRKFYLVKSGSLMLQNDINVPAAANPAMSAELSKLVVNLDGAYGKGKYCPPDEGGKCYTLEDASKIMSKSRDPEELKKAWSGWHSVSPSYRKDYARLVELANVGAKELNFKDTGEMWRSVYDMPPEAFSQDMERVWLQLKPLYDSLYTYVRAQLVKKYGPDVVKPDGLIPAHLLGNMWAQSWGNIYDVVAPQTSDRGYDLTKILEERKTTPKQMIEYGEKFFVSLGFPKLPQKFWEQSMFAKPADREVVCHASAFDMGQNNDVRIKMCTEINEEDFVTVHHELGHDFYYLAYAQQPFLFRGGANDGFHEAIGDAVALSVTPEYLKELQLIDTVPDESADIGLLLHSALDKVAFLPFGYLVDKWRWDVFSGKTPPADYNKAWWTLREHYQGVSAPMPRSEDDFDAGAKYHIAGNTPYARYFLAAVLQYQFHRALCKEAGYTGPLHRCSIYGNAKAGEKLRKMMALGASKPWPVALKEMTGEDQLDATAIIDYFAPLKKWLDEQNKNVPPRKDS